MLQPGDILLWRIDPGAPWIDRLIGWGERRLGQSSGKPADYYHVGFVSAASGSFYQAKPPRVCLSAVPSPFPAYLEAYRLRVAPAPDALRKVFGYADSRLGKLYDFLGVLTGGFLEAGGLEFCSKFTNDAFSYAGIVLAPSEELISPDDIAASPLLARVQF
jgi:hypothetical protein